MKIPVFDTVRFVDEKGYLTPEWQNILQQLFQELQVNFSDEGLVMPSQSIDNINKLNNLKNGTQIYDSTNNSPKIVVNGVLKTITTS